MHELPTRGRNSPTGYSARHKGVRNSWDRPPPSRRTPAWRLTFAPPHVPLGIHRCLKHTLRAKSNATPSMHLLRPCQSQNSWLRVSINFCATWVGWMDRYSYIFVSIMKVDTNNCFSPSFFLSRCNGHSVLAIHSFTIGGWIYLTQFRTAQRAEYNPSVGLVNDVCFYLYRQYSIDEHECQFFSHLIWGYREMHVRGTTSSTLPPPRRVLKFNFGFDWTLKFVCQTRLQTSPVRD